MDPKPTLRTSPVIAIIILFSLFFYPSSIDAFDTYWHSTAASTVGKNFGFSSDAVKSMQVGSFICDYYWLFLVNVESTIEKGINALEFRSTKTTVAERNASSYMHFDNLDLAIDRNWKFDYIWTKLLDNTKNTIVSYYNDEKLGENDRKKLILLTLGASLHAVEDFYCHSDWIHFDFSKYGFSDLRTADGLDRAPTWFEARHNLGIPSTQDGPENWGFRVSSGKFPPKDDAPKSAFGVPLSHTPMNHDNSQLYFAGASQIKYHGFGKHPATDSASAAEHQAYAFRTAVYAASEWVGLLESNPDVRTAIEFAKNMDLSKGDKDIPDDLEDGLNAILFSSCAFSKWDGSKPPPERKEECEPGKTVTHIHFPKQSNKFWGAFPKYKILENLTKDIGDKSGHYTFNSPGMTGGK